MFGLIRRLSYSVIPRPDRPWEDDPTSNAPHKPRKRRLSSSEPEDAIPNRQVPGSSTGYAGESATKRARGEGASLSSPVGVDEFGGWSVPPDPQPSVHNNQDLTPPDSAVESRQEQEPETQDVKEVTQGVKEVELEDKVEKTETRHDPVDNQEEETPEKTVDADVHPESVPLPDEDHVDELDGESGESGSIGKKTEAAAGQTTVDSEKQDEEQTGATNPGES
ncbi:hypothetical protein JOM56_004105 [Amanita muscaria]